MLRRHELLRVEPAAWDAMLRRHPGLADVPLVADWARHHRPVIVRRRMPGDLADGVPAALPLPPCHGRIATRARLQLRFRRDRRSWYHRRCFAMPRERRRQGGSRSSRPCSTSARRSAGRRVCSAPCFGSM